MSYDMEQFYAGLAYVAANWYYGAISVIYYGVNDEFPEAYYDATDMSYTYDYEGYYYVSYLWNLGAYQFYIYYSVEYSTSISDLP
jgi:hypothetical protein